nr:hypothetical protein [Achromobacter pulmonis]
MMANFSCELTPLVGSSISSRRGLSASATAMSMSLRMPSGSEPISRLLWPCRWNRRSSAAASSRASGVDSGDSRQKPRRAAMASSRFCSTVCSVKSCGSWKARAMPSRAIRRGGSRVNSTPSNCTLPAEART